MRFACRWLVVAALMCPVAAVADEKSDAEALARQAVELSVADGMDATIERMMAPTLRKAPADQQAAVKADLLKATAGPRADLLATFTAYYAQSFTPAELREIIAFYGSPLGRKLSQVEQHKPAEVGAAIQADMVKLMTALGASQGGAR